jgi:putative ABC transport system permease protein
VRLEHWAYKVPLRVRSLVHRTEVEQELNEELHFHFEQIVEQEIANGQSPQEARQVAQRKLGNLTAVREEARETWGWKAMDDSLRDLKQAVRIWRKNPTFAAMAVLTLALGIGQTTAMFTVVRSVLLKPLPYQDPDRLVQLSGGATSVRFREMQNAARSYTELGAYLNNVFDVTLSGGAEPEVLKGVSISANFLNTLAVRPLRGRGFRSEEDTAGGPLVAMISETLWRGRFAGEASILGKTVVLTGFPYTIIGVLPRGFQFPAPGVDVWVTGPTQFVNTTSPQLAVFGRLNAGVSIQQATSELAVLNRQYRSAHPGMLDGKADTVERVEPLKDRLVDNVRSMLWVLFGAIGFVLLIACANVASLLLARGASRWREFAVRAAIGASRVRIVNQLLAESVVLAAAAGGVGVLLARWILIGISHMTALDLPRAGEIELDGRVLVFAVFLSIATGVLFGLIPSVSASQPDLATVLRASGEAGSAAGKKKIALGLSARGVLVIGQIALSMILLIGAALLMRSLAQLNGVNPGFNTAHLLTFHISLAPTRYATGQKQAAFFDELVRRMQSLPAVRGAAATLTVPMTAYPRTPVQLANQPLQPLNKRPLAAIQDVTTAYFHTLQVSLRRGREFSDLDAAGAPFTAVINESLARLLFPAYPNGPNPVGQRILIGAQLNNVEIVGIVADMHQVLEKDPLPAIFRPFDQYPLQGAAVLVRTSGDPLQVVPAVRAEVRAMDRDQPISTVQTMEDLIEAEGGQRRVILILLEGFAGVALLLAVIGIYGLIAYSVAQRTQEIGIRRALGAQDADILRLVMRHSFALTVVGVSLGIGGALALTRLMTSLLFRTSPIDAPIFAGVTLLFVLVACAASSIPAHRAARTDPMAAIRI